MSGGGGGTRGNTFFGYVHRERVEGYSHAHTDMLQTTQRVSTVVVYERASRKEKEATARTGLNRREHGRDVCNYKRARLPGFAADFSPERLRASHRESAGIGGNYHFLILKPHEAFTENQYNYR